MMVLPRNITHTKNNCWNHILNQIFLNSISSIIFRTSLPIQKNYSLNLHLLLLFMDTIFGIFQEYDIILIRKPFKVSEAWQIIWFRCHVFPLMPFNNQNDLPWKNSKDISENYWKHSKMKFILAFEKVKVM